jgi:hypothetical protein
MTKQEVATLKEVEVLVKEFLAGDQPAFKPQKVPALQTSK